MTVKNLLNNLQSQSASTELQKNKNIQENLYRSHYFTPRTEYKLVSQGKEYQQQ